MSVIVHRRGSATEWASANPVLAASEFGYITSGTGAGSFKIGNGTSDWNTLKLFGGVPVGAIMMWYTNTAPDGWIFCRGQSTSAYPDLTAVIGATVPDMKTRVPVGRNVDGTGNGIGTFGTLGATGGYEAITLDATMIPAHTHSGTTGNQSADHSHSGTTGTVSADHSHTSGEVGTRPGANQGAGSYGSFYMSGRWNNYGGSSGADSYGYGTMYTSGISANHTHGFTTGGVSANHTHSFTTGNGTGGGLPHNNLQPYIVVNYIIKT